MMHAQLIATNLRQINHLYRKMLIKELLIYEIGQHFEVLWILADQHDPVTQNKLAGLLQVDKSQMVHILSDLEKRKLIERTRNPSDRREHYVSLAVSAREAIVFMEQSIQKINKMAVAAISEDKLDVFFEVSEQIRQNLKTG